MKFWALGNASSHRRLFLTIVDDATHESIAVVAERAIGGYPLTRMLDRLGFKRGLSKIIRTDNGKGFCGRTMLDWSYGLVFMRVCADFGVILV
jgi:hypothetical protein